MPQVWQWFHALRRGSGYTVAEMVGAGFRVTDPPSATENDMALKMHNETKPKTTANRGWGKGGIPTTKAAAKPKAAIEDAEGETVEAAAPAAVVADAQASAPKARKAAKH